jgi:hypothetical protein
MGREVDAEAAPSAQPVARVATAGVQAAASPIADRVLSLQRSAGNRVASRLVRRVLAREDQWSPDYKTRRGRAGKDYEGYKKLIGTMDDAPAMKAASEWGGTKLPVVRLTRKELGDIVQPEGKLSESDLTAHNDRLDKYLDYINDAFEAMGIDTVEAQSIFLAHAAESGSFAQMTEKDANQPYAPFIGRGPIQVTFEAGYVQALAYLETRVEQLESDAAKPGADAAAAKRAGDFAAKAREAVTAIKGDITQAANPKYAFLFSSAFMHNVKGVKRSAELKGVAEAPFAGAGAEDRWVTGETESFASTKANAPARTKAAEEARDAAREKGDTAGVAAAEKKIAAIKRKVGLMPSFERGAKIKAAIYKRAYAVLMKKVAAGPQKPDPAAAPVAPAAPAAPTSAATPAPPAAQPPAAKPPARVAVNVRVIKTEDILGADEVYVRITGPGGTQTSQIHKLNDGESFKFVLPGSVVGDGTKPVTVQVFDEDWPDADDLIVHMTWTPSSGPQNNRVSYDEADYRVTVSAE